MGEYMWIIILIAFLVVAAIVLSRVVSRKNNGGIHSKLMNDLLSENKNIFKDSSSTLENMMSSMIQTKKKILEENADDLAYISQKEAEIESSGVRIKAKAVKDGLTDNDTAFCKHCGTAIDSDSKFCKKCGKEQ